MSWWPGPPTARIEGVASCDWRPRDRIQKSAPQSAITWRGSSQRQMVSESSRPPGTPQLEKSHRIVPSHGGGSSQRQRFLRVCGRQELPSSKVGGCPGKGDQGAPVPAWRRVSLSDMLPSSDPRKWNGSSGWSYSPAPAPPLYELAPPEVVAPTPEGPAPVIGECGGGVSGGKFR